MTTAGFYQFRNSGSRLYIRKMKPFIKETIIVIAFIMICVLIKSASTSLYLNSHADPATTEAIQENAMAYGRKVGIWCLLVLLGLRYGRKIFRWISH